MAEAASPALDVDSLELEALRALCRAQKLELDSQKMRLDSQESEIERMKLLILKLKRLQFGRKPEKIDRRIEQLELRLEELEAAEAEAAPAPGSVSEALLEALRRKPARRELPAALPRATVVQAPAETSCPDCGGALRQARAKPLVEALRAWFYDTPTGLSKKSETAGAIRYALGRWPALARYVDDGELEIDNNAAERALRAVALGRKNYLFAGSDTGGERAATMYSLIGTAKLNGVDPEAYLRHVLERIAELLPWNVRLDGAAPA
jgi:hypothetical protein